MQNWKPRSAACSRSAVASVDLPMPEEPAISTPSTSARRRRARLRCPARRKAVARRRLDRLGLAEKPVDDLDHSGAAGPGRDEVGGLLDRVERVGDGHRAAAGRRKAWSFSASPMPMTLSGESPISSSAAARPVALLTPGGSTITAPLLKMICHSSPSSWIVSSTMVSFGSQVATMPRPTDSGETPRVCSIATNCGGGSGASGAPLRLGR